MRLLSFSIIGLTLTALNISSSFAGRLDLVVIQLSGSRGEAEVQAALAGANLEKISESNRVDARGSLLDRGVVIFAQGFPCERGKAFAISTRIGTSRVDTTGKVSSDAVSAEVMFFEESVLAIKQKSKGSYGGTSLLKGSGPVILSLRVRKVTYRPVIKNDVKPPTGSQTTTAVLAQFRP